MSKFADLSFTHLFQGPYNISCQCFLSCWPCCLELCIAPTFAFWKWLRLGMQSLWWRDVLWRLSEIWLRAAWGDMRIWWYNVRWYKVMWCCLKAGSFVCLIVLARKMAFSRQQLVFLETFSLWYFWPISCREKQRKRNICLLRRTRRRKRENGKGCWGKKRETFPQWTAKR